MILNQIGAQKIHLSTSMRIFLKVSQSFFALILSLVRGDDYGRSSMQIALKKTTKQFFLKFECFLICLLTFLFAAESLNHFAN